MDNLKNKRESKHRGNPNWKPGQSGNPKGRPCDKKFKEALEMLKGKSPELMAKALEMAMNGSEKVIVAILSKICPDKLEVAGENGQPFTMTLVLTPREKKPDEG